MTIDMLFKISLLIVVCGIGIKLFKLLSKIVFKFALIMVAILLFVQFIN